MDRATRDKFVASTDQSELAYGETACLETPPDFFHALDRWFHFGIDLTANEKNHLLPLWYGPKSPYGLYDALAINDWSNGKSLKAGFSNPPYGPFIEEILRKAVEQAATGFTSVFLLPMRASSWYTEIVLVHATFLLHLEPRLTFWYNGVPKPTAKVKASAKQIRDYGINGKPRDVDGVRQWIDTEGNWSLQGGIPILRPANALFDSIVVGFCPQMPGLPHVPYTVCPKVWRWKEQPVQSLL